MTAPTVVSNEEVGPGIWLMWVEASAIAGTAEPGQFAMVRCSDGHDPLLRRPLSFHRLAPPRIAFLFEVVGRGTEWLAHRKAGDAVDLLGPLGKPFTLHPRSKNLLLVAGGMGIAPLLTLGDRALAEERSVTLLLGARSQDRLYPLSSLPLEMEVDVSTEDGSAGRKGLVTERLPDFLPWADQVFACGPATMYQAMRGLAEFPKRPVQVLVEMPMGCGVGGCYGCVIETKHGLKRTCKDGPRFELAEIV
ncbi:MAG: dihydroorotate dehydrogenase electron transfer subunit [Chloroflexi bacterium]|nr:dihydroorotate dehydrogenase electron transfer subunit [Chloroflexota bacterium]